MSNATAQMVTHPQRAPRRKKKDETPHSIFFFPNGQTAVCNKDGQQIGKYQGRHDAAVAALKADGFDWLALPEVLGVPSRA